MSKGSPENLEARYHRIQKLARGSHDMYLFFLGMTAVGTVGFAINSAYVVEKYFPLISIEEVQQGIVNPATEAAAMASIGPVAFLTFTVAALIANGYYSFRTARYEREERRLLKEIEKQSKRPPTLGI